MTAQANPTETDNLGEARSKAVQATLDAEELEKRARRARRRATALQKHYEELLLIAQGQDTLPHR